MARRLFSLALATALAPSAASAQTGPSYPRFPDGLATAPAAVITNAPFDVVKFFDAPPRDENAATLYLTALAEFDHEVVALVIPSDSPAYQDQQTAVHARFRRFQAIDGRLAKNPGEVTSSELDGIVAEHEAGFRLLREAQLRDRCVFQSGVGLTTARSPSQAHVQAAFKVARVATRKVRRELDRGEVDEAIADVATILRLARDIQPRGSRMCQSGALWIMEVVCERMIHPILAAPGLTPAQCSILLATLRVHESRSVEPFAEGLKAEYVEIRVALDDLVHHQDRLARHLELAPGASVVKAVLPAAFVALGYLAPLPDDVDARLRKATPAEYARMVDHLNAYYRPLFALAGRPRAEQVAHLPDVRKSIPAQDLPAWLALEGQPEIDVHLRTLARYESAFRAHMALLALRRWQLTHAGASPAPSEFAAACRAAGLPAIPPDPFDGKPLQYALDGGAPTVSSIGKAVLRTPLTYRLPPPAPAAP